MYFGIGCIKEYSGRQLKFRNVRRSEQQRYKYSPDLPFLLGDHSCLPSLYLLSLPEVQDIRQIPVFPTFPSRQAVLVVQPLLVDPRNPVMSKFNCQQNKLSYRQEDYLKYHCNRTRNNVLNVNLSMQYCFVSTGSRVTRTRIILLLPT